MLNKNGDMKMGIIKQKKFYQNSSSCWCWYCYCSKHNFCKSENYNFQRSKPNGKLNIAFIGVGGRGRGHLKNVFKLR